MSEKLSIIVCDDHPLFRSGVCSCLNTNPKVEIVAEASDGEVCIARLKIYCPDILVTDLSMPVISGFDLLEWAADNQPDLRIYVLSMYTELNYLQKAREMGANGFIAKEDAQSELLAAIEHDGFYVSESVGRQLSNHAQKLSVGTILDDMRSVSVAEKKVLVLLTQSLTSREIAAELNISHRTVQAHRISLAEKLNAKGPNKLLRLAIRYRDEIIAS